MQELDSENNILKLLEAFAISFFFILIFYPGFLFLQYTPMAAAGWELSDAAVSSMNFEPSFKVFQYELFTNHNLLWSNLRSMGLPLLANDIHTAPLFPLTIFLSWVPADYFWNVFIVARLLLMGVGTYLLARDFLKFKSIPAIFFTFCFIYSLYVLRWMNHSFQNGLLAGIWYLYFLYLLTGASRSSSSMKRFFVFLGLTVSVYSMVTCGFPESAAMFAVLVVLVYTPFLGHLLMARKINIRSFLFDLLASHVIGFALSSAQIFSIFEMLSMFEGAGYRETMGTRQFSLNDFFPFWADNIARITGSKPTLFNDSRTYFGLIPLFLFFLGLFWTVRNFLKIGYRQVGAFLCCAFILLKLFPFWPEFNAFVGGLPVLKESYFFIYFFSIFLWFFAFYVARGVQVILDDFQGGTARIRSARSVLTVLAAGTVLTLIWWSVPVVYRVSLVELFEKTEGSVHLVVIAVFLSAFLVVQALLVWGKKSRLRAGLGFVLLFLSIIEMFVILPRNFLRLNPDVSLPIADLARKIEQHEIPLTEGRIRDPVGAFVSSGFATIDNGAPAVLPHRLFVFRRSLFNVRGGYFPVKQSYFDYSWALTSTSLFPTEYYWGGMTPPAWKEKQVVEDDRISMDVDVVWGGKGDIGEAQEIILSGRQPLYLRGWAFDSASSNPDAVSVFVVFRSSDKEITMPTRKMYRSDIADYFDSNKVVNSGWQVKVDAGFFEPDAYDILVRVLRDDRKSYLEVDTGRKVRFKRSAEDVQIFQFRKKKFGRGGVFVDSTQQGFIYYDRDALPRAYEPSRCFSVDHFSTAVQKIRDKENFRLGDVFVEGLSKAEQSICDSSRRSSPVRVPIVGDAGKRVTLGSINGPAVLVLNDTYYPGWRAFDQESGRELDIKPANIAVRALVLPEAREYSILFKYVPVWLSMARILVGFGGAAILILFGVALRRSLFKGTETL